MVSLLRFDAYLPRGHHFPRKVAPYVRNARGSYRRHFLALHLFGSATGLWGVWNFSYFELMKGVTYQGNFYQGVDWISWVLLHMLPCCIPCAVIGFKHWARLKKEAKRG